MRLQVGASPRPNRRAVCFFLNPRCISRMVAEDVSEQIRWNTGCCRSGLLKELSRPWSRIDASITSPWNHELARLRTGAKQQMLVTAHFNDGFVEDVTRWVRFESTNAGTASVDEHGLVEMKGAGEAGITGMYLSKVDVGSLVVPYPNKVDESVFSRAQRNNYIDPLVLDKLQALNIEPSGVSSDSEFLRRASLDATGTLPTASEAEEFLASKASDKRSKLIERLTQQLCLRRLLGLQVVRPVAGVKRKARESPIDPRSHPVLLQLDSRFCCPEQTLGQDGAGAAGCDGQ